MEKTKKTVIITGYKCNNRCIFCNDSNKRYFSEKSTQDILAEMAEARNRGSTYIEIIGGEQTIRPDTIQLLKFADKLKFRTIAMATNGRMFSYENFVRKAVDAGLTDIIFSIHGHTAKLHDSLTQVDGSFKELMKGIENFKKLEFKRLGSNTTIVKQNYRFLPDIGKFIYGLGIRNSEFIFVDPTYGSAYDNFDELVPRISKVAPYVKRCLDIGKNNRALHWHVRYVPICHFLGYENQISEIYEREAFHTEHLAPDFKNLDVENSRKQIGRIKPEKCEQCGKHHICEGIWVEYYKHFGDKELKPLKVF